MKHMNTLTSGFDEVMVNSANMEVLKIMTLAIRVRREQEEPA
jgi:hypothetical protein